MKVPVTSELCNHTKFLYDLFKEIEEDFDLNNNEDIDNIIKILSNLLHEAKYNILINVSYSENLQKLNEKYKNTEFYFLLNKISSVSEYGYSFIGNISEPISLIKIKKYISKPYSNKEEEERFKPFTNCVEHEITFLLHLNAG